MNIYDVSCWCFCTGRRHCCSFQQLQYLRVSTLNAFKCFKSVRPYVVEPCSSHLAGEKNSHLAKKQLVEHLFLRKLYEMCQVLHSLAIRAHTKCSPRPCLYKKELVSVPQSIEKLDFLLQKALTCKKNTLSIEFTESHCLSKYWFVWGFIFFFLF